MSHYSSVYEKFDFVSLQGRAKVEEAAPGVATGMILSLRERFLIILP